MDGLVCMLKRMTHQLTSNAKESLLNRRRAR